MRTAGLSAALLSLAVVVAGCTSEPEVDPAYLAELEEWRSGRVERLTADEGWLAVVGLDWLDPGVNTFGSHPQNDVVIRGESVPPVAGRFIVENDQVWLEPEEAAGVLHEGAPATRMMLAADTSRNPTVLQLGTNRFYLIERGGKLGIRVKDSESEARRKFTRIESYPIDPAWRKEARFEPYDPPKEIPIANVLGMTEPMRSPGAVVFEVDGKSHRLDALAEEGSDELFLIFADATSGAETYGGGRYLYAAQPVDGRTVVDFNKAFNPPCVFTEFATCPLPPIQNRLPIEITAGEKNYAH